jgi:hypothetical protein
MEVSHRGSPTMEWDELGVSHLWSDDARSCNSMETYERENTAGVLWALVGCPRSCSYSGVREDEEPGGAPLWSGRNLGVTHRGRHVSEKTQQRCCEISCDVPALAAIVG